MTVMSLFLESMGWLGAALVVAAYGFVSYGLVDGRSKVYQALNILGSLLLAINTAWHHAWPSAAVNVIWMGIAVGALALGPRLHHQAGSAEAQKR